MRTTAEATEALEARLCEAVDALEARLDVLIARAVLRAELERLRAELWRAEHGGQR